MEVEYRASTAGIAAENLRGFFVGWPSMPSPERHLELLRGSHAVELALAGERVVGFANAISDGGLSAYVPLLEVLPEYQGRGIGSELVRRLLKQLQHFYMVDVVCDPELEAWYARFGLQPARAMILRNRAAL